MRGERPPPGTLTLAMAATLRGLEGRSESSLRMHLRSARTGRRWCGPGDRRPRELYDEREVLKIAEGFLRNGENPYRPNQRLHTPPRTLRRRSSVPTDVPDGWVTTAAIRDDLLARDGIDVSVRTVRRLLDLNCNGPPHPDSTDTLINEAFGVLLDDAGQPRPPTRIPSEVRLVGQRIQRVYPRDAALAWIEEIGVLRPDEERAAARTELIVRADLAGVKWRHAMGRRNPWVNYVRPLTAGDEQRFVTTAHRIAAFVAEKKKRWTADKTDVSAIIAELRDAIERLAP